MAQQSSMKDVITPSPGPWRTGATGWGHDRVYAAVSHAMSSGLIAVVYGPGQAGRAAANAKLMAAAYEMLDVIKRIERADSAGTIHLPEDLRSDVIIARSNAEYMPY